MKKTKQLKEKKMKKVQKLLKKKKQRQKKINLIIKKSKIILNKNIFFNFYPIVFIIINNRLYNSP